jgi:hypothetical protein
VGVPGTVGATSATVWVKVDEELVVQLVPRADVAVAEIVTLAVEAFCTPVSVMVLRTQYTAVPDGARVPVSAVKLVQLPVTAPEPTAVADVQAAADATDQTETLAVVARGVTPVGVVAEETAKASEYGAELTVPVLVTVIGAVTASVG